MTCDEWNEMCDCVTDRMRSHVRNFVCPLSSETETEVRLIGTGSFIEADTRTAIITCEHVAKEQPLNWKFSDEENIYGYRGEWRSEKEPIDTALTKDIFNPEPGTSRIVKAHRIASSHKIAATEELLFFCGFAGENSKHVFGYHFTNMTGYCTQQNAKAANESSCLELLWPSGLKNSTNGTSMEAKKKMKFSNPRGFSGSLIWNTRFVEFGCDLEKWSPDRAKVTGILKRFDDKGGVLIGTPIEAVRNAMNF